MSYIKYRFKVMLGKKITIFWSFLYPIILVSMFSIAFQNILVDNYKNDPIKVSIIHEEANQDLTNLIKDATLNNNDPVFEIVDLDLKEAEKALKKYEIEGYIVDSDQVELYLKNNDFEGMILKNYLDSYVQVSSSIKQVVVKTNNQPNLSGFKMTSLVTSLDISKDTIDPMFLPFFSAVAMGILFGSSFGIKLATSLNPLKSSSGKRILSSGYQVYKFVIIDVILASIIVFASGLLAYFYINYGLGINISGQLGYVALTMFIGSLMSVLLGYATSLIFHKSKEENIIAIVSIITLVGSFLSGMMVPAIAALINQYVPFMQYLNPVYLITNSLFVLRYTSIYQLNQLYLNWGIMLFSIIVFTIIIYVKLGRKSYEYL
ncbi:MAG: ABC transporter permease [Bacilli bacterium]